MSYDVSIAQHEFNYTSNLADLFHFALSSPNGDETGLQALDQLSGKQALEIILEGFERLKNDRFRLFNSVETRSCIDVDNMLRERYDSPNGWGSYIGAILFLTSLAKACYENQDERIFAFY